MATFETKCPFCGAGFEADEEWIGETAECPGCGKEITIQVFQTSPEPEKKKLAIKVTASKNTRETSENYYKTSSDEKHVNRINKDSEGRGRGNIYHPNSYDNGYDQLPYYRRQWFFWLMFFTIQPIAIGILLFGDVYYQKKGVIKSFGLANRIVAGIIALGIPFYYYHLFTNDSKPGFVTKKIVREEEGLKSKVKESVVSSSNPIRDELLTYVNVELPKIADLETSAVNSYSSVTGSNYKDDETTYKAVRDDVLPKYKEFRDKLEAISIKLKTTEVRKLNESYIDAANTQLSAFSILLAAIDKQDLTLISQANEKLDKGRKLMRVTLNEFSVLAEKNKVEFKGK